MLTGRVFAFVLLILFASAAHAIEGVSRLTAEVGGGIAQFDSLGPSGFTANSGTFFNIKAEKSFGGSPVFLETGFDYYHTTGTLNYNYTSPTANYTASQINYNMDGYQIAVALRLKIIESYPIHPYIEGGVTGGYTQLSYDNTLRTPSVLAAGSDYKTSDNALDFGGYGEGGLELEFGHAFGIGAGYRYMTQTTGSMDTLNKQKVQYIASIYHASFTAHF